MAGGTLASNVDAISDEFAREWVQRFVGAWNLTIGSGWLR